MSDTKRPEKQASTGKRLVVLHATTTDDFLCEYLDTGMGIPEDGLERETGGGHSTRQSEEKLTEGSHFWPSLAAA